MSPTSKALLLTTMGCLLPACRNAASVTGPAPIASPAPADKGASSTKVGQDEEAVLRSHSMYEDRPSPRSSTSA